MKNIRILFVIALLLLLSPAAMAVEEPLPFRDIEGHWAQDVIVRWVDSGVISGYEDGTFRPDNTVTEAELAQIVYSVVGYPERAEKTHTRAAPDAWYYEAMNSLAWHEVVKKIGPPDNQLSRGDAVELIYKGFRISGINTVPDSVFPDTKNYAPILNNMYYTFYSADLVTGYPDGSFQSKKHITRAEVLQILDKMMEITIDKPGSYTFPANSRVVVTVPGVTIENSTLKFLCVLPSAEAEFTLKDSYLFASSIYGREQETLTIRNPKNAPEELELVWKPYDFGKPSDQRFSGGHGTKEDPYLLSTEADLRDIAFFPQNMTYIYFKLLNDVQLTRPWPKGWGMLLGYIYFDGGGHTISGLSITRDVALSSSVGFFDTISGSISNLTLEGEIRITGTWTTGGPRAYCVGGFAGRVTQGGGIENCISKVDIFVQLDAENSADLEGFVGIGGILGNLSVGSIVNCQSYGKISAEIPPLQSYVQYGVGGICGIIMHSEYSGTSDTSVVGCYSAGDVTSTGGHYNTTGGIVGISAGSRTSKSIVNCFSDATVSGGGGYYRNNVGGIAGQIQADTKVVACAANAEISVFGQPLYYNCAGGLVGSIYFGASIYDSYSTGTVTNLSADSAVGGLVGRVYEGSIYRSYTTAISIVNSKEYCRLVESDVSIDLTIENCGVFCGDAPFLIPSLGTTRACTQSELRNRTLYEGIGWDFESVWMMPGSASKYSYPILRGVYEQQQKNIST